MSQDCKEAYALKEKMWQRPYDAGEKKSGNKMNIRKSTEQDFERMMEIHAYARDQMIKTGNPNQWGPTNWPPEALIHHDIEMGNRNRVRIYKTVWTGCSDLRRG